MKYIEKYLSEDSRIIEIGAGTGRYSIALAEMGYDVTAIELVSHNIEIMKSKVKAHHNIKIYEGKYDEVYRMAKGYIDQGKIGSHVWVMEDGTDKGEYEFILDYCLAAGAK